MASIASFKYQSSLSGVDVIVATSKTKKSRFMDDTISSAAKRRKKVSIKGVRSGFNMSKNKSNKSTDLPASVVKNRNYSHVQLRYNKQAISAAVSITRPIDDDWSKWDCTNTAAAPNYDDWNNCWAWNDDPIPHQINAISPNLDIWDDWDCTKPQTKPAIAIENPQKQNENKGNTQWHSFDSYSMPVAMGDKDSFLANYTECPDEPLGEGNFGSVVKGIRLCDQLPVAIKKINKNSIQDWTLVNGVTVPLEYCILNEVHKCKSAIHLIDAFDLGDDYAIITDLIDGSCTLFQFTLEMYPIDGPTLKLASRNLVEALQQCHEAGVYHCDIKETNILIHPVTKVPTLIDFGLAALAVDSPYWGSCGTKGYMAPEIVANLNKWDGKTADIFALGVVLKNMYDSSVLAATTDPADHETTTTESSQCLKLVESMLQTCPNDRPSLEQILQHPWLTE